MAAPISLRLDKEMRTRVERIARRRKVPASHILREAVSTWVEREEEGVSPYEAMKDLIGVARGNGLTDLSQNTGQRFAQLLDSRQRRPQP